MKHTLKKGVLFLVLAVLVAGGVFAQRVGDVVTVFDQEFRVQEYRDGRLVMQLVPSLNGVWTNPGDWVITITGNSAVYTQIGSASGLTQDAINKGFIRVGGQSLRNLRRTGDLTWSGQTIGLTFNNSAPNVATGIQWYNCTITISADGQTMEMRAGTVINTYIRRR